MTGAPHTPDPEVGFTVSADELGRFVIVEVDTTLFDTAAIFKTAYWGTEQTFLYLTQDRSIERIYVEMRPKAPNSADLKTVAREFCNALIDHQTRQIILKETVLERDVLLTKAFSAGHGHLDPANLP